MISRVELDEKQIEKPARKQQRPKKERHTAEEFEALPEERRVEMVDGVFYDMASPTVTHQELVLELAFRLKDFVEKNNGDCRVFIAPLDVRLKKDKKLHNTIVEPDVIVVCGENKDKITEKRIEGAPDMVIEVVSPGSQSRDYVLKQELYMKSGVREYWIVDPGNKSTVVFLQGEEEERTWLFEGKPTPVSIFGGELKISFKAYA